MVQVCGETGNTQGGDILYINPFHVRGYDVILLD